MLIAVLSRGTVQFIAKKGKCPKRNFKNALYKEIKVNLESHRNQAHTVKSKRNPSPTRLLQLTKNSFIHEHHLPPPYSQQDSMDALALKTLASH